MSQYFLLSTFLLYLLSSVTFVMSTIGKVLEKNRFWERFSLGAVFTGVGFHFIFIVMRVWIGGHFPTSNMFEFISFLCFTIVVSFLFIYLRFYQIGLIGCFVMPLTVILLSYASVFPKGVQPLIPALQSHWLFIHVTTAALGEGAFAISFIAGFIYVISKFGNDIKSKSFFWIEAILVLGCMVISFSILSTLFGAYEYHVKYEHVVDGNKVIQEYDLPPLIKPNNAQEINSNTQVLIEAPSWMKGEKAARKLNSVFWSILTGLLLYGLLRFLLRKRLTQIIYPLVKNTNQDLVDEFSYRAIAIGYPIFTLGALIFAMIWAQEAWGRFWGWDPKETWALITWLFYSAYLHLRLSHGWRGIKSAWLSVGGFIIILINLIIINLVISGLHSYA